MQLSVHASVPALARTDDKNVFFNICGDSWSTWSFMWELLLTSNHLPSSSFYFCDSPLFLHLSQGRLVCAEMNLENCLPTHSVVVNSPSDGCLENAGYQDVFQTNRNIFFSGQEFSSCIKYVGQNSAWRPSASEQCKSAIMVQWFQSLFQVSDMSDIIIAGFMIQR